MIKYSRGKNPNSRNGFKKGQNFWQGRKHSELTKKKLSENHKGKHYSIKTEFKKGNTPPYKGKKIPKSIRKKMSDGYRYHTNSGTWKRELYSLNPYSVDWTETLKRSIRERDRYVCQICGKEPSTSVHHIDYNKKNCNPNNLIILCHYCHSKTNFRRKYWINYFNKI